MDLEDIRRIREARAEISRKYCEAIEQESSSLNACAESQLLIKAAEIWGNELPPGRTKDELILYLVVAAQAFIDYATQGRIVVFSSLVGQRELIERAAKLEFEGWQTRFKTWCHQ